MRPLLCLLALLFAMPAAAQRIVGPPTPPPVRTGAASPTDSPLTRAQMIAKVVAGSRVYGCPARSDWFSDRPGICPEGTQALRQIVSIRGGYAIFKEGGFTKLKEQPSTARK